ncbi:MAG: hypothetical protein HOV81_20400 [Kofleriaceae bacterium]|nr:hypothetical protein [Kofleriaceae bacterium]
MLRRTVLAALEIGVDSRDEDAARNALRKIDPIARGVAKRRLERALIDAALACDTAQVVSPSPEHVMRIAALAVAGKTPGDVGDLAGVMATYQSIGRKSLPRFPLFTVVAALLVAALVGGVAFYIATRPGPPSRTYVRVLPPPAADAYAKGGVPLSDPALDSLLGEQLTKLVIEGGRARDHAQNDLPGMLDKLHSAPAITGKPALAKAWDDVLATFARSVLIAQRPDGPSARERDDIRESVRAFSDALHQAGLAYFLEGRFKSGYPYIQAYRVEEVVFVVAGGAPRRVLSLRRLDTLNSSYAVLGMHDEDTGDPTLHLDRIDVAVASRILPTLAPDATYKLGDDEWMRWEPNKALGKTIGAVIRREYAEALGKDAAALTKIAELLVKRGDIIDEWRDKLGRHKIVFSSTDDLFIRPELLAALEGEVPNYQRKKVVEIDNSLAELGAPRIHARVHDLVAASVRRHEAQHAFDYDRDTELRYPQALADMLGAPHDMDGNEVALVRSARAELSGYLSQIANDPATPHASLWHLAGMVFDRNEWGSGECYAGVVVLEGLAKKLGMTTFQEPRFQRGVNRERFMEIAKLLAAQPDAKLREAATALWTELFGEPLTTIVDAKR